MRQGRDPSYSSHLYRPNVTGHGLFPGTLGFSPSPALRAGARRCADLVTAASGYLADRIGSWRGRGRAPIYLPNAVDLSPVAPVPLSDEPPRTPSLLLYTRFNEFAPTRGAKIVSQILDRVPTARAVIVGDGPAERRQAFSRELERRRSRRVSVGVGCWPSGPRWRASGRQRGPWLFDDNTINAARSPVKLLELMAHGRAIVAEAVEKGHGSSEARQFS